jgi:acid phosphatase family membrane protein YuiD
MMEDIHTKKKIKEDRLRELVGHSPIEVLIGILVGVAVTFFFYY